MDPKKEKKKTKKQQQKAAASEESPHDSEAEEQQVESFECYDELADQKRMQGSRASVEKRDRQQYQDQQQSLMMAQMQQMSGELQFGAIQQPSFLGAPLAGAQDFHQQAMRYLPRMNAATMKEEGSRHKHFLTDQQRLLPLAIIKKMMKDTVLPKRGGGRAGKTQAKATNKDASEYLWQQGGFDDEEDFSSNYVDPSQRRRRDKTVGALNDYQSLTAMEQRQAMPTEEMAYVSDLNEDPKTSGKCTKISEKAAETMQEIVTEFILFVTSEAVDLAKEKNRGTIQGEDFLKALKNLGFDHYLCYTSQYFNKMQDMRDHQDQKPEQLLQQKPVKKARLGNEAEVAEAAPLDDRAENHHAAAARNDDSCSN